jgi:hypothetical protein
LLYCDKWRIWLCEIDTGQHINRKANEVTNEYTGCSTRTWISQYRQNKTPFLNDVYLSWLSILPIGSDTFP